MTSANQNGSPLHHNKTTKIALIQSDYHEDK